ncbi:HipA family kinase [Paenibacillus thermotolerans]|uniref:HipA family kinase n=1 Tax=Paenibacillus thermotolerans TaxID=3027807 RepID=UPI0023675917|nr:MULTISPECIES: HipA family kinase [unclassified Paenibacillus]
MEIRAVQYVRPMNEGWSEPHLFTCDDGLSYVVKFMNNPDGPGTLANEWIASQLGPLLNLPMTQTRIVWITRDLLETYPMLKSMDVPEGPHIGSLFEQQAKVLDDEVDLSTCANVGQGAGMIVFDHWINNGDRHEMQANVLYVPERNRFMLIDHADAFFGPGWEMDEWLDDPGHMETFWGPVYRKFVPYIDGPDPFGNYIALLRSIGGDQVKAAVHGLPREWGIGREERERLVEFLMYRKDRIHRALRKLVRHFPQWKRSMEGHD